MKGALRLVVCFALAALTASTALGARVLKNGDRWPFGSPRAVALDTVNSLVFVARGNVLTVLNTALVAQGSIDLDVEILCISYAADHVYAALGSDGLAVVDVSTPVAPVIAGTFSPADGSSVAGVFVSGNYAYITNIGNRFKIVNVSNPANPTQTGAETLSGLLVAAVNVHVNGAGTVAAVADQVNGLHLINVSDKSDPQWRSVTGIAGAFDVRLDGSYAYVASIAGGLDIVDISNTSDPEQRGGVTLADGYSVGVFVAGNTTWLADQVNGLHEIDVTDRDNPGVPSTIAGTEGAYSVAVDGADVFVCDYALGLQRIGGGSYDPPAKVQDLFADRDEYLYVMSDSAGGAAADEGLRILDAFNPGNIGYESFVATPGQARGVYVAGDYAYVADGGSGLQIIDVSNKSNPGAPVNQDTAGTAYGVYAAGNYAYIADGDQGLQIIDISNKAAPAIRGNYNTNGTAAGVFVRNSYAYIADGTSGLVTLNVSDPANPSKINAWSTGTTAEALNLHVVGEYVYVAEAHGGAAIYRLTDEDPFVPTPPPDSGGGGGCFITGLTY